MKRVVPFPVALCLMVMASGGTLMILDRVVVGMSMLFGGLIVGSVFVAYFDHQRRERQ